MSAAKPALVVGVGEGCVPATRRALRRVGAIARGTIGSVPSQPQHGSRWYVLQRIASRHVFGKKGERKAKKEGNFFEWAASLLRTEGKPTDEEAEKPVSASSSDASRWLPRRVVNPHLDRFGLLPLPRLHPCRWNRL
ncbi:hypothetical protein OPV22_023188 [Ensete ventricosum]|uniref:Uncharacterized protein n=1 Tax=Ensete ventricosum TaxID=4639 RepID=A0AAV8PEZ4_ENSVE|nr:hypothetical protein OPV22_023188 [Ensete ventricosum]